jgi:hypothetical protein
MLTVMRAAFAAVPLLALVVGCVPSSRTVKGPDGEDAYVIRCPTGEGCYEEAASVCPGGYVLRSAVGAHTLLVSCTADLPAPPPVHEARADERVCEAASNYTKETAAYWGEHFEGKLLSELPGTTDFVAVCRDMPDNVQRCMHAKYRAVHGQACDAVLSRLDPYHRNKVDGLFFAAPERASKKDDGAGRTL